MKFILIIVLICSTLFHSLAGQDSFNVKINIDAESKIGPLNHIWRFFGADEPNYAYMKNGKTLIEDLGSLKPGEIYFRTHNLLTTGDGTYGLKWGSTNAYREDENGDPIYYWGIIDSIFDTYVENGVRPYVEIGFMPQALSVNPEPYRHFWNPTLEYSKVYTGWAYPPDDYEKWGDLIYEWVKHCIDRYGKNEVSEWYWETWNEPNISYWQGTEEEFLMLHDYAIDGVIRALPDAKVGGPDVAGHGGNYMRNFIDHCLTGTNYATGRKGTKMDFLAFHAKGSPVYVDGHVRMNMGRQLSTINTGFEIISSYPEIENIPIVIGESDPEGCAACQGESLGYRNGTMYSSYTAAIFMRKMDLALQHKVNLEGALTWAFEFEEQPYFAGFRSLSTNGINKPVFSVFKMFSMMEGDRLNVISDFEVPLETIMKESVRDNPDVTAIASIKNNKMYIMVWHYHDDDIPGPNANIQFSISNLPYSEGRCKLKKYIINNTYSNSYTLWKEMGSPQEPTMNQIEQLIDKSNLEQAKYTGKLIVNDNILNINDMLERQGVILYIIEFPEEHF